MFSFLNTLDVLPVAQVEFIAATLAAAQLDAAILLKAKTGLPGFISLNVWIAHGEPICRSIATEIACCAGRREELRAILEELIQEIQEAIASGAVVSDEASRSRLIPQ